MSTRATVHFVRAEGYKPDAIIYRHSDGYPSGLGRDLGKFLQEVKGNVRDNRFDDSSYLAAKFVVWQARQYTGDNSHFLDFLSIGILAEDPGDIEYRYVVVCTGENLKVHCMRIVYEGEEILLGEVYPEFTIRDEDKD